MKDLSSPKLLLLLLLPFLVHCRLFENETSETEFTAGWIARGHEVLTKYALNNLDPASKKFFDRYKSSSFNLATKHPVIYGSYVADFPDHSHEHGIDVAALLWKEQFESWKKELDPVEAQEKIDRYRNLLSRKWHPFSQASHFTRNYYDFELTHAKSAYESCHDSTAYIRHVTHEAIKMWHSPEDISDPSRWRSMTLIGIALHTMQDSFSTAHTIRDQNTLGKTILDICSWRSLTREKQTKEELANNTMGKRVCFHGILSGHGHGGSALGADMILNGTPPDNAHFHEDEDSCWEEECLKEGALDAVKVSEIYLKHMARLLPRSSSYDRKPVDLAIDGFFESLTKSDGTNPFDCSKLSRQEAHKVNLENFNKG